MTTQASALPQTKACPFCAETIRAEAIRCRYCGADLKRRRPGRTRKVATSPLLIAVSLVMGSAAATIETMTWVGRFDRVREVLTPRRNETAVEEPFPFGPSSVTEDDVRVGLLISALAIGIVGAAAALLARRRPFAATLLFVGAGLAGLGLSLFAGLNVVLVALSALLLAAGIATVVSTRRLAT